MGASQQGRSQWLLSKLFRLGILIFILLIFKPKDEKKKKADGTKPMIPPPPSSLDKASNMATVLYLLAALYAILFFLLDWTCHRWPIVARALLIENREPQPPGDQQNDESQTDVKVSPIDPGLWILLCIFLTNLAVCVLWYAFLYDSVGTSNPSWTDVFGK